MKPVKFLSILSLNLFAIKPKLIFGPSKIIITGDIMPAIGACKVHPLQPGVERLHETRFCRFRENAGFKYCGE